MTPRRHEVIEVRGNRRIRALYVDGKLERIVSEPLPPSPPPPPIPAEGKLAPPPQAAPEEAPAPEPSPEPAVEAVPSAPDVSETSEPAAPAPRMRPVFEILSVEPAEAPAPIPVRVPVQGRERAHPAPEPVADETPPAPEPIVDEAPPRPEAISEAAPEAPAVAMEAAVETAAPEPVSVPARAEAVRSLFGKLKLPRRRTDDAMPPPETGLAEPEEKARPFLLGKLTFPTRERDATAEPAKSLAERLPKLPSLKLPKRVAKPPPRDPDLKEVIPPAPRVPLAERLKRKLGKENAPAPDTPADAPSAPTEAPADPAPTPEPEAALEPAVPEPRVPFVPTPQLLSTIGERVDAVIARAVDRRIAIEGPDEGPTPVAPETTAPAATGRVEPIPEPSFAPLEPAPWEDRLEAVLAARGSTKR